jgi:hypothetical protein
MAANEPEAATGVVEGWEFKISPGQDFTGPTLQCCRPGISFAPIHVRGSALKTIGYAQASK